MISVRSDTFNFLEDCDRARQRSLRVPSALKQIRNLGIFVNHNSLWRFYSLNALLAERKQGQDFFAGFENLDTLLLGCMDNNSHNDESLSDFTTEFDSTLLNPHQKVRFDSAFSLKRELLKSMEAWKREKKNPELKVPEVNIMARAGLLSRQYIGVANLAGSRMILQVLNDYALKIVRRSSFSSKTGGLYEAMELLLTLTREKADSERIIKFIEPLQSLCL